MGTQQPIRKTVTPEIPDKLYFRIGDVARLCEVPTYVLRFWETEFPQLKPNKGGTGQRLYRRRDVELALRIKSLLYDQGYTIPGARQVFKNESAARSAETAASLESAPTPAAASIGAEPPDSGALLRHKARLRDLREDMAALLATLGNPAAGGGASSQAKAPELKLAAMPEAKGLPLRPRLVLEPWPTKSKSDGTDGPSGVAVSRPQLSQRDLFFPGSATEDEWPEPPVAS